MNPDILISLCGGVISNPLRRLSAPASFELRRGECIAVVGTNGSGKSTLLEMLRGGFYLREGSLRFGLGGEAYKCIRTVTFDNAYSTTETQYYHQQRWQAFERESSPLAGELLGIAGFDAEAVGAGMDAADDSLGAADAGTGAAGAGIGAPDSRIDAADAGMGAADKCSWQRQLLRVLNIRPLLGKPIITLSSGELRRFSLARALMDKPEVLILESPFIGLDPPTRQMLIELLGSVLTMGVSIVMTLTDTARIPDVVTHVYMMDGGRLSEKMPRTRVASSQGSMAGFTADAETGSTAGSTASHETVSTADAETRGTTGSTTGSTASHETGCTAGFTADHETRSTAGSTADHITAGVQQTDIQKDTDYYPHAFEGGNISQRAILQYFTLQPETRRFNTVVQMRDINIAYGQRQIFKGLNWTVHSGEKWNVTGPNGSGKSTLLSLVNADNPRAYSLDITLFDRRRGTGESIWDIKRHIGYLSSEMHSSFRESISVLDLLRGGMDRPYATAASYAMDTAQMTSAEGSIDGSMAENIDGSKDGSADDSMDGSMDGNMAESTAESTAGSMDGSVAGSKADSKDGSLVIGGAQGAENQHKTQSAYPQNEGRNFAQMPNAELVSLHQPASALQKEHDAIRPENCGTTDISRSTAYDKETYLTGLLRLFGAEHLAQRNYLTLSSGEQRYVLLIRAFVNDPALLILDEPFQGLDASLRSRAAAIIKAFCSRENKTLIFVTHYIDEIPDVVTHTLQL